MLQTSHKCERPYELGGKQKRHMPSRQTQLLQTAAELLQDTLSSHHQTTGTSGQLYLVLIPTRLGVPFQYLQPAPFYAFEISGRCPRSSAKVLARCIDNHSRRLRFTCRMIDNPEFCCLFISSNDSMMKQAVNPSNSNRRWFTDFLRNPLLDLVSDHGIVF